MSRPQSPLLAGAASSKASARAANRAIATRLRAFSALSFLNLSEQQARPPGFTWAFPFDAHRLHNATAASQRTHVLLVAIFPLRKRSFRPSIVESPHNISASKPHLRRL